MVFGSLQQGSKGIAMSRRDQQGAGQSICSKNRAITEQLQQDQRGTQPGTDHSVADRARTEHLMVNRASRSLW